MSGVTTITSKRQLTIPIHLFEALGFSIGEKVVVDEVDGELRLRKATTLVTSLAGSVEVGQKNIDVDEVISQAKKKRFSR